MAKGNGGSAGKAGAGSKGGSTAGGARGPAGWPSTKPGMPSGGNRSNAPAKR